MPLVLVRTPTYRRPEFLKRAMKCLQAQSHGDWLCEIRDDCPDGSARAVVEELGDPRISYAGNHPQKFAMLNIDDCFRSENLHKADYFFVLEDDNQVLPGFMAHGREIIEQVGVQICQINQSIEHDSRTERARIGDIGVFDDLFDERVHAPEELHLAMFGAIGVSNGALFWSKWAQSDLAVRVNTIPIMDEFLRNRLIVEPIYISLERLAVWAKNEESTSRNLGLDRSWLRRELDLKASVTALQRMVWQGTPPHLREAFLTGGILRLPRQQRFEALRKAGIKVPGIGSVKNPKALLKRFAVRRIGRPHASVADVLARVAA